MATLAIFTVKKFAFVDGVYWTYGGFGEYLAQACRRYDKVILACHPRKLKTPPKGWYEVRFSNVDWCWLPYYERETQAILRLPLMFLKCALPAIRADYINARLPDYSGIFGAYWGLLFRKTVFSTVVADWHADSITTPIRGGSFLKKLFSLYMKVYVFQESFVCKRTILFAQGRALFNRLSLINRNAHLVYSTSISSDWLSEKKERVKSEHSCTIISVGRHVEVKGHKYLIEALSMLKSSYKNVRWRLLLVGEGGMTDEYLALSDSLSVRDSITISGQVTPEALIGLFDSSDIFCLPSLTEGTPKVVLEAFARRIPVVATRVGGVPDLVRQNETGFLVRERDTHELAAAIASAFFDDLLREMVIKSAYSIAKGCASDAVYGSMFDVVECESRK